MSELTVRDFLVAFLQSEYSRYSKIILDVTQHIERLHNELIIETSDRATHLKEINDIIKNMNNTYNNRLKTFQIEEIETESFSGQENEKDENIEQEDTEQENTEQENFEKEFLDDTLNRYQEKTKKVSHLIELVNLFKITGVADEKLRVLYFNKCNNDFIQINQRLRELVQKIGANNINTVMNLFIGESFEMLFKTNKKTIDFYNNLKDIFVPIEVTTQKNHNIKELSIKSTMKYNSSYPEVILDSRADVTINIPIIKTNIVVSGYFIYDSINIQVRTSQICNIYLFNKKKEFEEIIEKQKYMSDKFRTSYLKNLTTGEILSHDTNTLTKKLDNDYERFSKITRMSFKNLMTEFNKDNGNNLLNMYNIIRLLLLGNEDSINIAGLLFGLTKDRKFGNGIIADIIYKNLSFSAQSKLRKSSVILKQELDKLKAMTPDDVDTKRQIAACKNMPANVKKVALEKVEEMKTGTSEYYKQFTYVNILINYPWEGDDDVFSNMKHDLNKSREFLERTNQVLNERVFGHEECKKTMQELIGKWLTNPNSMGKAIGLVGPPGVGKTLIAKGLGDALGIPFAQINLGGLEDGCVLSGHSYTYSAAQPGLIVRKMVEAGKSRCVIFFDELDKACTKHGVNEIFNVLIHATDTNTNTHFNDKFFQEVTFPLSKVLFVFSYNDASKVDRILLDRMEKIEVKPYSVVDKLKITKDFLLKEISESVGIDYGSIQLKDNDIEYLIENYTFEAGVRELKRKLENLFLKINLDRIYKRNIFESRDNFSIEEPIFITQDDIHKYLNKPNLNIKKIHKDPSIGVINGLYATTVGAGGIIPILIYNNFMSDQNKFTLKITGSQGKVMKESVHFAFTTAMSLVKPEYREKFIKNYPHGLHIHTPDGATPKDGPSAGSAFTTAFISRILEKRVKNDVALTGEIEMNGRVTEIGGLQYKLSGAKKAGIQLAFIPRENEKDYKKILENDDKLTDDNFKIIIVSHIKEILNEALIEDDDSAFDSNKYLVS